MADAEGMTHTHYSYDIYMTFLGLLDIYNTVKELRHRRVNMVANLEQYIFLHDSLLEAVLCGETGVTSNELSRHYDQLITGELISST